MEASGVVPQERARAESHGIDRRLAAKAVELSLPLIENAMQDKAYGDSGFLHIVVVDSQVDSGRFEDAILHEHSVGDRTKWDADYAWYARGKAELAWRERRDNPKGAVCIDGIVVGASGAFEPFDQAYAGVVAMWIRALARHEAQRGAAC